MGVSAKLPLAVMVVLHVGGLRRGSRDSNHASNATFSGQSGTSNSVAAVELDVERAGTSCTWDVIPCRWRQTGNCDPKGPREPANDKTCDVKIPRGWSGFCDCNGDGRWNNGERGADCFGSPGGYQPTSCGTACGLSTPDPIPGCDQCRWRQTSSRSSEGCFKPGQRLPDRDELCSKDITRSRTGWCDCNGNGVLDGSERFVDCWNGVLGNIETAPCDRVCR